MLIVQYIAYKKSLVYGIHYPRGDELRLVEADEFGAYVNVNVKRRENSTRDILIFISIVRTFFGAPSEITTNPSRHVRNALSVHLRPTALRRVVS